MSLRNEIKWHSKSEAHIQAQKIKLQANKETIENSITAMNKSHFSATKKLFRIAYKIGKIGRPFTDLPVDSDIHVLDIGRTLHLVIMFVIKLARKCEQGFAKSSLKVKVKFLL